MLIEKKYQPSITKTTETDSIKPVVKSSFSRDEVIKLLDWLNKSNYHNNAMNAGWGQRGCTPYYTVSSKYVLEDAEKNCFFGT